MLALANSAGKLALTCTFSILHIIAVMGHNLKNLNNTKSHRFYRFLLNRYVQQFTFTFLKDSHFVASHGVGSVSLKVVSATFGPITMFKQQSLSFHVVSKTFIHSQQHPSLYLSLSLSSCTFLKQEIIEANTILKNNIVTGIILMTYTNALTRIRFY